jgi:hypothetical protein
MANDDDDDDDDPKQDKDIEATNGGDAEENYCRYWPIRNIKEPNNNDVLYGRGGTLYNMYYVLLLYVLLWLVFIVALLYSSTCSSFFHTRGHPPTRCSYVRNIHKISPIQAPPTTTWATSGFAE